MRHRLHFSSEEKERLTGAISRFPRYRILVVGDLMLDVFIWGEVNRISPEAPVPVVEVAEETRLLGGAANVVNNVAALGAAASIAGVIGNDEAGRELVRLMEGEGVSPGGLIVESARPTTVKTRIIARNQQVVRFDRESRHPLNKGTLEKVLSFVEQQVGRVDGVIVSDYAKGVVTSDFMDAVRSFASASGIPVVVDPKVRHAGLYRRVTMITPNHHEASRMSGVVIHDEATLEEAGRALLERLECRTVLITRGKEGMSLFHREGEAVHIPTVARRVFDVTGAGDTVIAAMTLGIVAGLSTVEAAMLANLAAGIVVGEVGTATASSARLLDEIG